MYKQFKTNDSLEKSGVWLDYGTFKVLIARAGGANVKFQKLLDHLMKPYKRQLETESLPEAKGQEILRTAYARAIILDWQVAVDAKGVAIDDEEKLPVDWDKRTFKKGIHPAKSGPPLSVTEDNITEVLKALPDLFTDIRAQSARAGLYKEDIREAEAGN